MMPRRPNSGSRPTSDGGRPQRLAAARSPHGRPRAARSPRVARSPRIGAPSSAPSVAEQQPPPVARIVDFGERREECAAAASAQRRRRRDADEAEFEGRAAPRPNRNRLNARWREQWRIVMVDIAMGPLPAHLSSRGGRSAPWTLALHPALSLSLRPRPALGAHLRHPCRVPQTKTVDVQHLGGV